jgi:hypothetical protein
LREAVGMHRLFQNGGYVCFFNLLAFMGGMQALKALTLKTALVFRRRQLCTFSYCPHQLSTRAGAESIYNEEILTRASKNQDF